MTSRMQIDFDVDKAAAALGTTSDDMRTQIEVHERICTDSALAFVANIKSRHDLASALNHSLELLQHVHFEVIEQDGPPSLIHSIKWNAAMITAAALVNTLKGNPLFDTPALADQLRHEVLQVLNKSKILDPSSVIQNRKVQKT